LFNSPDIFIDGGSPKFLVNIMPSYGFQGFGTELGDGNFAIAFIEQPEHVSYSAFSGIVVLPFFFHVVEER
jgi:hypothetical protein